MVEIAALAAEIDARLRAVAGPERQRIATTYFPTAMEVIGVSVPDLRALSAFDRDAVIAFVDRHESDLPSRVRREVATKLATGLKAKRRRV